MLLLLVLLLLMFHGLVLALILRWILVVNAKGIVKLLWQREIHWLMLHLLVVSMLLIVSVRMVAVVMMLTLLVRLLSMGRVLVVMALVVVVCRHVGYRLLRKDWCRGHRTGARHSRIQPAKLQRQQRGKQKGMLDGKESLQPVEFVRQG